MGFRFWIVIAAMLGALGVMMGAMGAHLFGATMDSEQTMLFEKAWRYHMLHVLAILFAAWLVWVFDHGMESGGSWSARLAAVFFFFGIVLFSGVLYIQALHGGSPTVKLVPAGGTSFILGWLMLMISGFRIPRF